ncbi:MAG: hypothetical protein ACR2HP_06545 [Ilumatobacteraceae bacterium]
MTACTARLTVTFHREVHGGRARSWWEAVRPTGGRVRGGYMPIGRGIIPHDLGHLVAESHLGIDDGIWGLLARGATFKRGTDRRPTRRGRALVAAHRDALHAHGLLADAGAGGESGLTRYWSVGRSISGSVPWPTRRFHSSWSVSRLAT